MVQQKEVQAVLKKTKLQNAKVLLKVFVGEDPFLMAILLGTVSAFYPPLLTLLFQALLQGNQKRVYSILELLGGLTILLIIPLLLYRTHSLNRINKRNTEDLNYTNKTNAEIKAISDFVQVRKYQEQEKFKLFEDAIQAKIGLLEAQTRFVMDFSGNFVTEMIKSQAQNLQEGFTTENIRETMDDVINIMGKVMNRFNSIGEQYDQAVQQMQKICDEFGIKLEDLGINTSIDPNESTESLEEKLKSVMNGIPPPQMPLNNEDLPMKITSLVDEPPEVKPLFWTCHKCKRDNDFNRTRCKNCNLSGAASLNLDQQDFMQK